MTAEQLKRWDAYPILVQLVRSLTLPADAAGNGHQAPSLSTVKMARKVLEGLGENI